MNAEASMRRVAYTIFCKELRELLRDRRAVFFSFVLPLFLYPILFFTMALLPEQRREEMAARELEVGVAGNYKAALRHFLEHDFKVTEREFSAAAIRNGDLQVFVRFEPVPEEPGGPVRGMEKAKATIYYAKTRPESVEGHERAQAALNDFRDDLVESQFRQRGARIDPRTVVETELRDVATDDEKSSARMGRLLPLVMVLLLLTGGSFAAIDLVAGEKERGTLETLYLHPVRISSIVRGKFSVVLAVSIAAVLLNYTGMILGVEACRWLGLGATDQTWFPLFVPPLATSGLILLLLVPFAVFTSSILLVVSAYARSFREAQTYLLPVTLVAMVGVALGLIPQIKLASIVAVIPVANVALGIREALTGQLMPFPYLVTLGSSCLYAWVSLRKATAMLHDEEIILSLAPPPRVEDMNAAGRARRALFFGCAMLLAVWYFGSLLQSWNLAVGLALTLWGVVLLPSLLYPAIFRLPARSLFGLCATPHRNYLWVILLVPAAIGLNLACFQLQSLFLPLPDAAEAFELSGMVESSPVGTFLLFALSPAICEELLWRGVFQGELEEQRRPVRTVLIVGLFFGLFHLSIYRLVTTGMTGVILAIVRHRSGSILPCMLFHCAFNASLIFSIETIEEGNLLALVTRVPVWMSCLVLAAIALRALRRPGEN